MGRGGALDLGVKLSEATAKAGAMDNARRATETTGQGLINQALGTGNQMAGVAQGATSTGAQTGATGIGEGTSTVSAQSPMLGNALGWFSGGNQAIGGFVNTTQAGFQDASHNADVQNQAAQAESAGWGKLAGTALSMVAAPFTGGASLAALPMVSKFAADGGLIPGFDDGGDVPTGAGGAPSPGSAVPLSASPSRGAVEDDVPARVQPGEFIFPKDVMSWKGEEWAQKEIMKARAAQHSPDTKPAKPEAKPALDLPPTYRSPGAMHGQAVPLGAHHAGA